MLLIAGAFLINYAVTAERLDQALAAWIVEAKLGPTEFMLMINIVFIALGCLIDTGTLILILVPLLLPTIRTLGIDLVHFGVVITINIMIGLVTPPFGMLLFTLAKLGNVPINEVVAEVWPFIGALLAALFVTSFVPQIVLFLPHLVGFH